VAISEIRGCLFGTCCCSCGTLVSTSKRGHDGPVQETTPLPSQQTRLFRSNSDQKVPKSYQVNCKLISLFLEVLAPIFCLHFCALCLFDIGSVQWLHICTHEHKQPSSPARRASCVWLCLAVLQNTLAAAACYLLLLWGLEQFFLSTYPFLQAAELHNLLKYTWESLVKLVQVIPWE
jgi:hypothetical protein